MVKSTSLTSTPGDKLRHRRKTWPLLNYLLEYW
jgi:hypothetical protein